VTVIGSGGDFSVTAKGSCFSLLQLIKINRQTATRINSLFIISLVLLSSILPVDVVHIGLESPHHIIIILIFDDNKSILMGYGDKTLDGMYNSTLIIINIDLTFHIPKL